MVRLSNQGGYQSQHDIFQDDACKPCLDLRAIVSAAVVATGSELPRAGGSNCSAPDGPEVADSELAEDGDAPQLLDAYAWLNLNHSAHSNALHTHCQDKWSAVYFVCAGGIEPSIEPSVEPSIEPSIKPLVCAGGIKVDLSSGGSGGQLVFRGGAPLGVDGPLVSTHSYMAVPPRPGTLRLFPGAMQLFGACRRRTPRVRSKSEGLGGDASSGYPQIGNGSSGVRRRHAPKMLKEAGTLWLFPGAVAHLVMRSFPAMGRELTEKPRISVAGPDHSVRTRIYF